jgi:hypothetical protein
LSPSIRTNYRRITMVSKKWGERLTIDFDISATNLREKESTPINLKNLIIIEVKSVKDRSIADSIMENHQIEKATNCSKYSLWLIYLGLAEKYDTFKETIQKIGEIRMETVKKTRRKRETWKTSLDKMIKKMKIDTIKRVNLIIT